MKHLLLAVALLLTADVVLRHGEGVHAMTAGAMAFGHAVGEWVYY